MLENALEGLTSSDTTAISHIISKFEHKASVKQDNAYYSRYIRLNAYLKTSINI